MVAPFMLIFLFILSTTSCSAFLCSSCSFLLAASAIFWYLRSSVFLLIWSAWRWRCQTVVICMHYWSQPTLAFSLCWISRDISFLCLQTRFLFWLTLYSDIMLLLGNWQGRTQPPPTLTSCSLYYVTFHLVLGIRPSSSQQGFCKTENNWDPGELWLILVIAPEKKRQYVRRTFILTVNASKPKSNIVLFMIIIQSFQTLQTFKYCCKPLMTFMYW